MLEAQPVCGDHVGDCVARGQAAQGRADKGALAIAVRVQVAALLGHVDALRWCGVWVCCRLNSGGNSFIPILPRCRAAWAR